MSTRALIALFAKSGVLKFTNLGLGVLTTICVARLLPVSEVGTYSFYIAMATLLSVPAALGVPEVMVRELARRRDQNDWIGIRALLQWARRSVAVTAGLCIIGLVAWRALAGTSVPILDTVLVGCLVPLTALNASRGAALVGLGEPIKGQAPDLMLRPLLLLITLLLGFPFVSGATDVLLFYVVATTGSFLAGTYLLLTRMRAQAKAPSLQALHTDRAAWTRAALPLGLIAGLYAANQQLDLLLLGLLSTSEDVGVYRIVSLMALIALVGQQLVRPVVAPRFASAWHANNLPELERTAVFASRVSLSIALAVGLTYLLCGPWMLGLLFGEEYRSGYAPLMILTVAQVANAAAGSTGNLLNMCGFERASLLGLIVGLVTNIGLGIALIPHYGVVGASVAALGAILVWNVFLWSTVRKRIGIRPTAFRI